MTYSMAIVLYNPSEKEIENAHLLSELFDEAFIYDNSAQMNERLVFDCKSSWCNYVWDGNNHGLAYAYNQAMHECKGDWLAIFDQDSQITAASVESIKDFITCNTDGCIAMVVPSIDYQNGGYIEKVGVEYPSWSINSGSFLNMRILREAGVSYDEYYFLDRLDRDFCMQLHRRGLRIARVNEARLVQSLGELDGLRRVHSPIRHYYMARNRLYYNHKYYRRVEAFLRSTAETLHHACLLVREGPSSRESLSMIGKGIRDYFGGCGGAFRLEAQDGDLNKEPNAD